MEVYLDRADESEARGEHDLALAEIESALEIARGASHDPAWWRPAELRLGRWLLASGAAADDMRCAVAWVWCLRSARLHAGLHGTGPAST